MVLKQIEGEISLKDKYLSFEKEKRIRRMQFFERMLIPLLILLITLYFSRMILLFLFIDLYIHIFYVSIVFNALYILIILKYYPFVIKKRTHDYGSDGKIETIILLGGAILSTIISLYSSYLFLSGNIELLNNFYNNYYYITKILDIIVGITGLWVLFRPGTNGKNEYGEQEYYKLKFLG